MGTPDPAPAGRADLIRRIEETRARRREWIRRQVIDFDRVDILAREALGLTVARHHLRIAQHQHRFREGGNQILVWRGAGKSHIGTYARAIHHLVKNPDVRILIGSKSQQNAIGMLTDIKSLLEVETFVRDGIEFDGFKRIFGDFRGRKWDDVEFDVAGRTRRRKEASVTAVGVETAVASKHYDVILGDDLVDEESARTAQMRAKTQTFYYKTLYPCLEPGGEISIIGTFWHYADLYSHLQENEFAGERTLLIPAMTGSDEAGWTAEWPDGGYTVEALLDRRAKMGSVFFDSQYLMSTAKMKGEIFDIDWMREVDDCEIPDGLPCYTGFDLAISQKKRADSFAGITISWDRTTDRVYVLDAEGGKKTFREQRSTIIDMTRAARAVRAGVEATAYQEAQLREVETEAPDLKGVVKPVYPKQDKITRAMHLAARFEGGRIVFRKGLRRVIDQLLEMPKGDHDDFFDALDHAILGIKSRDLKPREEPGLL